jgi:transcriptional regulator with XRE-family HTH domain
MHRCIKVKIGEKVRWYRLLSGYDQDALAATVREACPVSRDGKPSRFSRQELIKIELDQVNAKIETLREVSKGLKRPLTDLIERPFEKKYEIPELTDDDLLNPEDLHERLHFILKSRHRIWAPAIAANIRAIFKATQDSLKESANSQIEEKNGGKRAANSGKAHKSGNK